MTARASKDLGRAEAVVLEAGAALQEEGLRLLFAEIRALQAMIPVGERELPSEAEIEQGFDNMPV